MSLSLVQQKGVCVPTTATIKTNHGQQQAEQQLPTGDGIHLCT